LLRANCLEDVHAATLQPTSRESSLRREQPQSHTANRDAICRVAEVHAEIEQQRALARIDLRRLDVDADRPDGGVIGWVVQEDQS
jgi:hypothetical protein